ncbi:unnamed protein product [Spirodela intermedia]|uniref:Uncharacterized protein n=1 Tax=Spirodela intermedia TaxID=51605 RepID=A0A7I8IHU3_SPIIN|nr:unnamed protein product [Spirodela intermedia]CAA6657441.1 unnamed protein product [Spirodela intermedia]
MEETRRILRRAIYAFLRGYQSFTSIAVLLVSPVSAAVLFSQAMAPSSSRMMGTIQARLDALFAAAGLPATSDLFSFLNLKFSQTIVSFVLTLPFVLTFLVLAKASVIQLTHLCSAFVAISANAAAFSLLFLAFNTADALGLTSDRLILCLSIAGAIVYSVLLANSLVACNLAIIVSGVENCGGFLPILKACALLRSRAATALSLALPTSLFLAAAEALFHIRVIKPYRAANRLTPSLIGEGTLIIYIYSLLLVLDIIVSCMFFKSCKLASESDCELGCSYSSGFASKADKKDAAAACVFVRSKLLEQQ